jgi:hypothetical protein
MSEVTSVSGCSDRITAPHQLQSLVVAEGIDPTTKQLVHEYKILCIRCGMSLEEIRAPQKITRRRKEKNGSAPAPASDSPAFPAPAPSPDLNKLD